MNAAEMLVNPNVRLLECPLSGGSARKIALESPWINTQNVVDSIDWKENNATRLSSVSVVSPWNKCVCFYQQGDFKIANVVYTVSTSSQEKDAIISALETFCSAIGTRALVRPTLQAWDGDGFTVSIDTFANSPETTNSLILACQVRFPLNRDGVAISQNAFFWTMGPEPSNDFFWTIGREPLKNDTSDSFLRSLFHEFLTEALTAFAFCNCRNTVLEKVPASRQVRRWSERHNQPVFEHHIIRIDKIQHLLRTEGGLKTNKQSDVLKAMHICRGHFARYGPQFNTGKLFGKHEGQFWIPQHVRGGIEKGLITTDYKIA